MKVEWKRLDDVVEFARTPIEIQPNNEYSRIGIYSWGNGHFVREPANGVDLGKMTYFEFPKPSLVFSNIQAWEGAVALVGEQDASTVCSSRFYPYVPRDEATVSLRFLFEFFRSALGRQIMRHASSGTQVRNKLLSRARIEAALVPVPSRAQQDHIADHLDSLAQFSPAIPKNRDSTAVLSSLISRVASNSPKVRIGSLIERSRTWIDIDPASPYAPVGVRGFGRGMIRYPLVNGDELSKMRYYRLVPGSLLVSNIKAWEGAVCTVGSADGARVASNRFLQYRASDSTSLHWLHRYLLTPAGIHLLGEASPGSADRNRTLSMDTFESIEVPLPDLQTRILVERTATLFDSVADAQHRRNTIAEAILPAARNEIFAALR